MNILEVKELKKIYTTRFSNVKVEALKNIDFSVEKGEFIAIMGESGSGKTTLLNILAGLDKPTVGTVYLNGEDITKISGRKLADYRRENLGFVFQEFNLLDTLSIEDNILLPLVLSGFKYDDMIQRLNPIVKHLNITEILAKYPYEVSGGQKQRAAVARALINEPALILADEPTGALDSRASQELLQQFSNVNQNGQTILMVTHSAKAASFASRVLFIRDGVVFHQIHKGEMSNEQLYARISDTLTLLANGGDKE